MVLCIGFELVFLDGKWTGLFYIFETYNMGRVDVCICHRILCNIGSTRATIITKILRNEQYGKVTPKKDDMIGAQY